MARKCKCRFCGKEMEVTEAYLIPNAKAKKYCCSASEYIQFNESNAHRDNCYELLKEYMGFREDALLPTVVKKVVKDLNQNYTYECIEKTIKSLQSKIEWVCNNKSFNNDFVMAKYVMAMVQNNIETVYKQMKQEEKEKKKEKQVLGKTLDQIIFDEEVRPQQSTNKKVVDISSFLD